MKIVKVKEEVKNCVRTGRKIVTVELEDGEELLALRPGMYRLGYPLEDMVVQSHHLADMKPVEWCVVAQKWID